MKKGDKFDKLTFIKEAEPRIRRNGYTRRRILCECECGNIRTYDLSYFKMRQIKRCYNCAKESIALTKTTHGLIRHPLYRMWQNMKNRCYNKKVNRFKNYGARGIKVCDEWKNDFKIFYNWATANGWQKHLQIERRDNDGNYNSDNCLFVTSIEQSFNKTNTFYVNYKSIKIGLGKILYLNDLSNKYMLIYKGIKRGKSFEYYVKRFNINMKVKQLSKSKMFKI